MDIGGVKRHVLFVEAIEKSVRWNSGSVQTKICSLRKKHVVCFCGI